MKNTVLITGGAQGIGLVTARSLAKKGYDVVLLDIDKEALQKIENQADTITCFLCDLSVEEELLRVKETLYKKNKRIVALINNAGISINKPIQELTLEEWNKVLATNLTSIFLTSKLFEEQLSENKGCIINIASTRAFMSEENTEAYSASKGGIIALTHALAISLGPMIRVNAISPGWIDVTPFQKDGEGECLSQQDHSQHPVGRVGVPTDVTEMIEFLLEKGSFITGQNFIIDGGMTRKMIYV